MKLIIAILIVLAGIHPQACEEYSAAEQDLKALNTVFHKATTLLRDQHPESSIVKLELKIRGAEPGALHFLTVLKNEGQQTCDAYYISATPDNSCQYSAQVGAKLNMGDTCLTL